MAQHRRRLRLTLTNSQYRLLGFSLIYTFITILIFAAALFLPLIIMLESSSLSPVEKQNVADQFLSIHGRAWPAILIAFVLLGIHSFIVSHRIAGPLYRFRCCLKAIADGNLAMPAIIRENDYLVTEAETINEMIASLRMKIEDIQEQHEGMNRVLSNLRRSIDSGSIEAISHDMENLGSGMLRLKECMDQFKTASVETGLKGDLGGGVVKPPDSSGSAALNPS